MASDPRMVEMPAAEYHRDPCPEPSLSSSIAKLICAESPAHARWAHPRLNPAAVEDEAENLDVGTAAHALFLEGTAGVTVIEAKDWRTNAAKDARDTARLAGKIPLLARKWDAVQAMVREARVQLDAHEDGQVMFRGGVAERVLLWREEGIWCRSRLDYIRPGGIDDYKTRTGSANPEMVSRTLFGEGWDVQAAFYARGVRAVTSDVAQVRFVCQETYPPYALSVVSLGPAALALAEQKVEHAIKVWRECLATGRWPAYPTRTAYANPSAWAEQAWLEKEAAKNGV